MEPSLPTTAALAIAGDRIVGGVGTHEWALPTPDRVDLRGRCVLPAFTDSHVHFPTWSLAQRDVSLEGAASLDEALARSRRTAPAASGSAAAAGATPNGRRSRRREALDAGGRRDAGGLWSKDYHSLWLSSAALARAGGDLDVPGGVVERDARRRADRHPARGVRLAVPRAARDRLGGRVGRRDARGPQARGRARRRRDPRQGRLARRAGDLRPPPRVGRAVAARLAVAPAEHAGQLAELGLRSRHRRRLPAARLPEGVHGRDARLADRVDARRDRRPDHERRGARRADPRRRGGRLAGRRPRDRRPREPRGARCLRGDAGRVAAARAPAADRARAVPRSRRRRPLRRARRRLLGPVQPRALRSRPGRALLGRPARGHVRVPVARRERRGRRRTARTRRSRSSTRSPGSAPACCARSTTGRRGVPRRR